MTLKQLPIRGPFQGVVSDLPSVEAPPAAFDDVLNFFVRKGRVQSRPVLNAFVGSSQLPRRMGSFKDANGNWHTYVLCSYIATQTPAYMLTSGPTLNALTIPGLVTGQLGSNLPFGEVNVQNQVFFCNGGYPLAYLDGSNAVQFVTNVSGTGRFLAVNVNHVIMAWCTEPAKGQAGSADFPRRVRWSASGNPLEWLTANDFTAGSNDLLDVPDDITGLCTIGYPTFVWRTNGYTIMYPTGNGLSPFSFSNATVSEDGEGSFFPYALSTYGRRSVVISQENVNVFDGNSLTPIGGLSRNKIFNDLASAAGDQVTGQILPNFTLGYNFLCYVLNIPGPNVSWIYTFDDGQWVRFSSSQGYLTAVRTVYTS